MITVALPLPDRGHYQAQWDYILSSFPPDKLIVVKSNPDDAPSTNVFSRLEAEYRNSLKGTLDTLVVMASDNGSYVKGDESLAEFEHPDDAIYYFGGDKSRLGFEEIGRSPNHKVFIPTASKDDLFSWQAYAMVAWDRVMKSTTRPSSR